MFKYADYIYRIYEEKSFTKAAKKLYISQPSLSAIVKKAEQQLGFDIFVRGTACLTDEGAIYMSAIEEMRRLERGLKNDIENIQSLTFGDIAVSGAAFISSFILPKIIMAFSSRYPGIHISLLESNSPNLQEKLLSEEIDILIDYDFDKNNFDAFPIKEEHVFLAVPKHFAVNEKLKDFALSAKEIGKQMSVSYVDLNHFSDEKFILLKSGNNMHKISHKLCSAHGLSPQTVIEVDQLLTAFNMANAGMGVTFVTDTVIHSTAKSDQLLFYPINSPDAQRTLYIAHKKKKYIRSAVTAFIETAREVYNI